MSRALVFLAVAVACVATLCVAQAPAEVQTPLLFVSKSISSDDIVFGSSVEVTVTVYNDGQNPAFDVDLVDEVDDGSKKEMHFDSIPYGATETMRYTLTPKALGAYPVGLATVTYNTVQGDTRSKHTAYSSIVREATAYYRGEDVDDLSVRGTVSVLTREQYDRVHARHIKETVAYIFLGVLPVAFPFMFYRAKQSQIDELLRRAKHTK